MKKIYIIIIMLITVISCFSVSTVSPNNYLFLNSYSDYQGYTVSNTSQICIDFSTFESQKKVTYSPFTTSLNTLLQVKFPRGISLNTYIVKYKIDNGSTDNYQTYTTAGYTVDIANINFSSYGSHKVYVGIFNLIGEKVIEETVEVSVMNQNKVLKNQYSDELYVLNENIFSKKKPILIVEGFDPNNSSNLPYYLELLNPMVQSFSNYEVFFLNFKDGGRDLRDNAMTVLGTLKYIQSRYSTNNCEGIKVIGISMGGVIARYALAFAEDNKINHYCSQFISCDSPQRGATVNVNFQDTIKRMSQNSSIVNEKPEVYLMNKSLESTAAKQLLRTNIYVSQTDTYETGNNIFLNLFSELNPEERAIYGQNNDILNDDPTNPMNKPGFAYQYNNIKNFSISNGKIERCGNVNNHTQLVDWYLLNTDYSADPMPYDTQSGSTLGLLSTGGYGNVNFLGFKVGDFSAPKYDPVFVPTMSSLYLTPNSKNTNIPNDSQFSISNYQNINILSGYTKEQYLNNYTKFNECIIQPSAKYEHAYISNITKDKILDWINNTTYNNVGFISGNISSSISNIKVEAFVNNESIGYSFTNSAGHFSIPYPFIKSNNVVLKLTKSMYYPVEVSFSITYYNLDNDPNTGKLTYTIPNMTINSYSNSSIKVDKNTSVAAYRNINDAIEYVKNDCDPNVRKTYNIVINGQSSSPWNENVNISYVNNANLTLTGASTVNSNFVIDTDGIAILIDENTNSAFKFKNLKLANNDLGIVNLDTNTGCSFSVENCNFYNNINNSYMQYPGAGIHSKLPMNISNCQFELNKADWGISYSGNTTESGYGAAVYMIANNGTVDFLKNKVINNSGKGYAVYIYSNNSQFLATVNCKENLFRENSVINGQGSSQYADDYTALMIGYVNSLNFENNIITKEKNLNGAFFTSYFNRNKNVKIYNNTISENYLTSFKLMGTTANVIKISNNIISKNISSNAFNYIYYLDNVPTSTVTTNYNLCSDNKYNTNTFVNVFPNGFQNIDPQIYAADVASGFTPFAPIWNTSTISNSIDKGNPDLNGNNTSWVTDENDRDVDGSRKDIGALSALEYHKQNYKTFYGIGSNNYINWISIPSMNTLTTGEDFFPNVFEELYYGNFTKLYFNGLNGDPLTISSYGTTILNPNNQLFRQLGYQLTLPVNVAVDITGFDLPEAYEFSLVRDPNIGLSLKNQYNWCGYFLPQPMTAWAAFTNVLDKIDEIKTKNWTTMKVNGVWTNFNNPNYVLSYGDMAMVHCTQTTSTRLGNNNTQQTAAPRQSAQTFSYMEEEDYIPLFIDMNDESKSMPDEIGLFINGICQGAAVVDDKIVQLNAYVLNDSIDYSTAEISFELHYNGKSDPKIVNSYSLFVQNLKAFVNQKLDMGSNERYYSVKLNDNPSINYETLLQNNYPNPFNPSTTIQFSLKDDSNIELTIYNIKGQKVKTLKKGNLTKGVHAVVWDGKDNYNNTCSSGVYFYRLNVGNKTFNKKMLMIK